MSFRNVFFSLVIVAAAAAAALGAGGAGAAAPELQVAAGLRVTPPLLEFGAVRPGQSRARSVRITNVGDAVIWIDGLGVDGPGTAFGLALPQTCGLTLEPGSTCVVSVSASFNAFPSVGRQQGALIVTGGVGLPPDPSREIVLLRLPLSEMTL